jgi:prepilin-type N-terminal cleavage/methylation domain-containing protein
MHKKFQAFTLIELLVVIAIIGVLGGFIFVSMTGAINNAKDARRKADLAAIESAVLMYSTNHANALPSTDTDCNICNGCSGACSNLYANLQTYLSSIPTDPNSGTFYKYNAPTNTTYTLQSNLSNGDVYQYDSTSNSWSVLSGIQSAPIFSPTSGAVVAGTSVTITSLHANTIYYTLDNSDPTTSSAQYTAPLIVNPYSPITIKALAVRTGYSNSTIASATYTQAIQTTPTFSPVAGAVSTGTTVTIVSAGADAIYYTTNGTDPTTSSTNQATTPLVINSAVTVKAIAVKSGYSSSAIGTAAYTITYSSTCVSGGGLICTESIVGSDVVDTYTYSSGAGSTTWAVPAGVTQVQYLIVGGGGSGSGGTSGITQGGGGGGGAVLSGTGYSLSGLSSITVIVGKGGNSTTGYIIGNNGSVSSFNGISAAGGNGGGTVNYGGNQYGNGGPCGDGVHTGGAAGGYSGGGAGGGGAGQNGSSNSSGSANGGNGIVNSITGTSTYYGGGGGGSIDVGSSGGLGGGGNRWSVGINGLGGGGGGGYGNSNPSAGAGGSGVVIIRYTAPGTVNGVCGTANKTYTSGGTYGSDTFCSLGTASPLNPAFPLVGGTTTWTCSGINGGTVSCSASLASNANMCSASMAGGVSCAETTFGSDVTDTFTYSSGAGSTTWAVPAGVTQVQYLIVGGGGSGSGGTSGYTQGGGGGGGAVLSGTGYGVVGSSTISVVVGKGGSSGSGYTIGNNGFLSSFNGILAGGGGGSGTVSYGGNQYGNGGPCGDGVHTGGAAGGYSGGGAGGGGAGQNGNPNSSNVSGGNGIANSITGTSTYYGGGGGGSIDSGTTSGGLGGGGNRFTAGTNGLGGGGGGGYGSVYAGGSGVVIIRYVHP